MSVFHLFLNELKGNFFNGKYLKSKYTKHLTIYYFCENQQVDHYLYDNA